MGLSINIPKAIQYLSPSDKPYELLIVSDNLVVILDNSMSIAYGCGIIFSTTNHVLALFAWRFNSC